MVENIIKQYLKEIALKNKLLTCEEEIELAKRVENGDEKAKERLILSNLQLVVHIAKKYSKNEDNFLDIINEGNIGLIEAVEKFDYRKGVKFSSYSAWWIRKQIFRYFENGAELIRIPVNAIEERNKLEKLYEEFPGKFGYGPTYNEFIGYASNYLKMDSKKTKFFSDLPHVSVSLNEKLKSFSDGENNYTDVIGDSSKHFTTELEERCIAEVTRKKINELPKQKWIDTIKMRNGIFDKLLVEKYNLDKEKINQLRMHNQGGFSLKKISSFLGLTSEGVRQIEKKALSYMKEKFVEDPEILEVYH